VVGTWTVASSCLTVSGALDLALVGAGCPSAPVTGTLAVTGTFTANADGTYSDDTTTTGQERFTLGPSCLVISSTPVTCEGAAGIIKNLGYASVTCTSVAGGGCDCAATAQQKGGLGVLSVAPSTSSNYAVSGNVVTISNDGGDVRYATCVSGNMLTVTPQSASPTITGTIVLQKSGSSGTGGTTGAAGTTGSGGTSGSAGASGSGGAAGSGGQGGGGGSTGGSAGRGGAGAGRGGSGGAAGRGGAGGTTGSAGSGGGGATGSGGSSGTTGPCDIYGRAGNPCVAAHSTVRALLGAYSGKLYQVRNAANATKDILTLAPGGFADGPSQDAFCSGTTCVVTVVYDQSGKGNDLWYQGSTMVPGSTSSTPAKATSESLTLSGHKVYSLYINPNNSYWVDASKSGIALGAQPEGMYMVTNSKHYNGGCCFDYGNSETDRKADGSGAMDAINFSSILAWGTGAGNGPWVMADLEYGVFAQNNTMKNQNDPSQTATYVTAVLKNNGTTEFALRGGDATSGNLGTYYKGGLPGGWSPMKKQGAIVLGSGGDCCKPGGGANQSLGTFYEGCIVTGYPTDATEDAVQANVVAAGYGK
jgi:non-reducing end alpha-L-arabinofuranosidase